MHHAINLSLLQETNRHCFLQLSLFCKSLRLKTAPAQFGKTTSMSVPSSSALPGHQGAAARVMPAPLMWEVQEIVQGWKGRQSNLAVLAANPFCGAIFFFLLQFIEKCQRSFQSGGGRLDQVSLHRVGSHSLAACVCHQAK